MLIIQETSASPFGFGQDPRPASPLLPLNHSSSGFLSEIQPDVHAADTPKSQCNPILLLLACYSTYENNMLWISNNTLDEAPMPNLLLWTGRTSLSAGFRFFEV